jgi:hypothetical protein
MHECMNESTLSETIGTRGITIHNTQYTDGRTNKENTKMAIVEDATIMG